MSSKYDTPQGLEPDSGGVNEWVRYQLTRILDRTKDIENKLFVVCARQEKFAEFMTKTEIRLAEGVSTFKYYEKRIDAIDQQIKELKAIRNGKETSKNNDTITFQWALEKLALPVIMLIVGAVLALLFN